RRREPLRLPLSNQLTKEVLIHSGALREGGQPLKRGSKFEDMPSPSRNIEKFACGLSRYGSSSLHYYEPYPEADIVPAEVLLNPGTNLSRNLSQVFIPFPHFEVEERILRAGVRSLSLSDLMAAAGFAYLELHQKKVGVHDELTI